MCLDIYDVYEHMEGGTIYMDKYYTLFWVEDNVTGEYAEYREFYDDLTTATAALRRLEKKVSVVTARILWGDSIVEEYRRGL